MERVFVVMGIDESSYEPFEFVVAVCSSEKKAEEILIKAESRYKEAWFSRGYIEEMKLDLAFWEE